MGELGHSMAEEVSGNPLDKQAVIKGLGRITKSASGNQIVYTELVVEGEAVDSIQILTRYPHLAHLQLARNRIAELSPLNALPNLLTLDLSDNCLTSALDFSPSNNLQRVSLARNSITVLSCLPQHQHINTLDLSFNKIICSAPIGQLKHLRYIDLSNNLLSTIDGLCGQSIQELHLSSNQLVGLQGVETLKELQVLTVNHNKLKLLDPIAHAHALYALEAKHNQLELSPVVQALQGLKTLRHLSLQGNPMCTGTLLRDQSTLIAMPDMRRAVYRDKLLYRMLRLETLDGQSISAAAKVRAANFSGVDVDAHQHNFKKYFPDDRAPVQDRELVIGRLHRAARLVEGELIVPDVWVHRQLERCIEAKHQCVRLESSWLPSESGDVLAKVSWQLQISEPCELSLMLGCHDSCNAGSQAVPSRVMVQRTQSREERVAWLFQGLDPNQDGTIAKDELSQLDKKGNFFDKLDTNHDNSVSQQELSEYFERMIEARGVQAVDTFVTYLEQACTRQDWRPKPKVHDFLASSQSRLMATTEGSLGPCWYECVAEADLTGASVDIKGESFFLWCFGTKPFTVDGIDSVAVDEIAHTFSSRFGQFEQQQASAVQAALTVQCVSVLPRTFGFRSLDHSGGVDLFSVCLEQQNVCFASRENFLEECEPTGENVHLIQGCWSAEQELVTLSFVEGGASVELVYLLKGDSFTRQSQEYSDEAT